ncbi:hypothetical protein PLESTM_001470000 [Pleodorina starrii]|nr:hypothetical protein PLESTM_001470000 [Pleodorina starrii]
MLSTSVLETGGERQSATSTPSLDSSYLVAKLDCDPAVAVESSAAGRLYSPECGTHVSAPGMAATEDETSAGFTCSHARLQVALSAYSIRDIAQCDPAMHIRHLKPLSHGPDSVVYKGTWQGLLFAVKFMLYRGSDPAGLQRRVASLLAAQCMPQRSHLARVYACDLSEVVVEGAPPQPQPPSAGEADADDAAAAAAAAAPPALTVRPFLQEEEPDAGDEVCLPPDESAEATGGGGAGAARRRGHGGERFHFSSVVFSAEAATAYGSAPVSGCTDGPSAAAAAAGPGPRPTLQGLLDYLGARPGDYLLHCVSELASGGNLWHGIRSGAYDLFGPLGPLGALRMSLHTARGIAQGLQQLHASGEVHGGLSAANVLLLWSHHALGGGAGGGGGAAAVARGSGGLHKRRGFTARIADCGMRRLVLGPEWRRRLVGHPELFGCTAPELLLPPPEAEGAAAPEKTCEIEWQPCHDVFSFGAVLYSMCTGKRRTGGFGGAAVAWPEHVWPPLRDLGDACMATDPAGRPTAGEIVRVLLVLEQRLHNAGAHARCPRVRPSGVAPGPSAGGGAVARGGVGLGPVLGAASFDTHRLGGAAAASCGGGDGGSATAASTFLHSTAEEVDGAGASGGSGGGGIGLAQTSPALSRRPTAAPPPHWRATQRFGLASMPEVLLP